MKAQLPDFSQLSAVYINCTLKKSPETSHTEGLMQVSMDIMKRERASVEYIRLIDQSYFERLEE